MILFDSPGFDDTNRADIDLLKIIGIHLQQGAKEEKFLTGVIYMHNIRDTRMSGSAFHNLRILRQLCGSDHYAHIALVTSHWDQVDPAEGEAREEQLRTDFWPDMIEKGATVHQHKNTKESAIEILKAFLPKSPFELLFQKEFSVHGKVGDTAAGKEILQILLQKLGEYRADISKLTDEIRKAQSENKRMEGEIQTLKDAIGRLEQDRDRERERERENKREITKKLKWKQDLIDQANIARQRVEGEIADLKAEIDKLKRAKEKENSLDEELKAKQTLIASIAKEKAESDVQGAKKEAEGAQQGEKAESAGEEGLKSKDGLDAEGDRQRLVTEIARLTLEIEKQNTIKEELKLKEQCLMTAETSKQEAEKQKEQAENEVRRLREEMEKLQQDQEKEKAFEEDRNSMEGRIRDIERKSRKRNGEIQENTAQVNESRKNEASTKEAIMLLEQPVTAHPGNSRSPWPGIPFCTHQ
jgi:hypothetical protein